MASKLLYQSSVLGNGKETLLASSEAVDAGATFPKAEIVAKVVSTP